MTIDARPRAEPPPSGSRASAATVAGSPAELTAPLRRALTSARRGGRRENEDELTEATDLLERAASEKDDVPPLGRLHVALDGASQANDPSFSKVVATAKRMQGTYAYSAPIQGRTTLFLIHGSDRGPFDTFRPYLDRYAEARNLVYVYYDSFVSTEAKAAWLTDQIRAWQRLHPGDPPLQFLAWSDGATVLRKARLDDTAGVFRGATIVNLAPPLAGSYRARWVDDELWMRIAASPALLYLEANPHLKQMAEDYNPYGDLMEEMYGPHAESVLADRLGEGSELHVLTEGDDHAPATPWFGFLQPEYDAYRARYEASLAQDHVVVDAVEEHPHQAITHHPDALRAVGRHLGIASANRAP